MRISEEEMRQRIGEFVTSLRVKRLIPLLFDELPDLPQAGNCGEHANKGKRTLHDAAYRPRCRRKRDMARARIEWCEARRCL